MADSAELHRVGRFLVLEELGRGGMGVVLAAYDPDLDRKVAVKVLHATAGQSPAEHSEGRARLLREAQALARLSHPNVVTVHEVGTVGDQVFLAMELVRGRTLRQWVQPLAGPQRWRTIVATFRQAGEGLAAAHRCGLVHRDFKPENVLVDAEGRARVLDFGLARTGGMVEAATGADTGELTVDASALTRPMPAATSELDTPLTEAGQVMGTPAYMAPEQHMGARVDARSDQFAFCVALYEALYGERPFDGATFVELRTRVLSGASPSPSNARDVPAWILRVLQRGMQRAPEARHGSMDELLEVLGRDPGRRRRRAVAWGMAGLAVVGGGAAYDAHVERQLAEAREAGDPCSDAEARLSGIWDPSRKQEIRRAFSDTKLEYATGTWERAEARLDDYSARWVAAQQAICRATQVEHVQTRALLDVRQACLNHRLSELRAHTAVFARADGAVLEGVIGSIEELDDPDACRTVESMQVELPLPDDETQAARVVELRQRLDDVMAALASAGKGTEVQALADAAVADAEALGYQPLIAEAYLAMGHLLMQIGRFPDAAASFERALWAAEVGRHDAAAVDAWSEWVRTVGYSQHQPERARPMLPRLDAALHRLGKDVRREATVERVLGTLAYAEDDFETAIRHYEASLALVEGEPTPDREAISRACQNLGTALYRVGRLDESAALLGRAHEISAALHGPGHPRLIAIHQSLGGLARRRKDPVTAHRHYALAAELMEASQPLTHPNLASLYRNLGETTLDLRRYDEAVEWFRKAIALDRQRLGEDVMPVDTTLVLGIALYVAGRHDEAREPLEAAVARADEANDLARLATARFQLAKLVWDADAAERRRAVALAIAAHEWWLARGPDDAREKVERWLAEHRVR
jgi:tetratricopeptide (TPR) repeat protein/tRNA A-37 threonylcarbamoyl transferase component Bud32